MSEMQPAKPEQQSSSGDQVFNPEHLPRAPAAGWYPHPTMPHTQGFWDGSRWTEHIAPATQPAQQAIFTQPYRQHMVTSSPVRTSHTFHLLMTLLTCGLWLPIWGIVALANKLSREKHVTRIHG